MLLRPLIAKEKKVITLLAFCVLALVALTLVQDLLRSQINSTAFYLSEAFMFSSFWWLFAPLLFAQYLFAGRGRRAPLYIWPLAICLPFLIHLLAFPLLVWAMSGLFYYHTYAFRQVLSYALSEHVYQLAFIYAVPLFCYTWMGSKSKPVTRLNQEQRPEHFIDHVVVGDGYKKISIPVSGVLYFAASSPYIGVHCAGKKYLLNETLKSILPQLAPEQFIRVHKSTIVNIGMVASYTTRLNGDYDLQMKDGATLRVSRNFALAFKKLFHSTHQVTAK